MMRKKPVKLQPVAENVSSSEFTVIFIVIIIIVVTRTVTCGTNPLFKFLYRPCTKTEIIIVTRNAKVNSEDDTFSVIVCTVMLTNMNLLVHEH
jgi:uncharacterized protein YggT (Ycf19 family)